MTKKNIIYLIIAIISLILIVVGYYYTKKNEIFNNNDTYRVELENVTGLVPGASVMFHGLKVGEVGSITFSDGEVKVVAELKINNTHKIPKDAEVALRAGGLMDGSYIGLEYDIPCIGTDCAEDGQLLKVKTVSTLQNMLGKNPLSTELGIEDDDMSNIMDVFKQKVISPESDHLVAQSLADMDAITKMMDKLEKDAAGMSKKSLGKYERIMENVEELEKLLEDDRVKQVMEDFDELSKMMDDLDMEKPMKHAERTMENVEKLKENANKEIAAMNKSMENVNKTLAEMETLKRNMKSEDGSIQYFMDEAGMAKDVELTLGSVDQLTNNYENKTYLYKFLVGRKRFLRKKARKEKKEANSGAGE